MTTVLQGRSKLLDAMKAVNDKFGIGTMEQASKIQFAHRKRFSTGIFKLDVATGGGLPKGRITMIVGDESVGKSTLCTLVAASAQHTCRKCMQRFEWHSEEVLDRKTSAVKDNKIIVDAPCPCGGNEPHVVAYFDAEGTFDPAWAMKLGLDIPSLILVTPEYAEQGADMMCALIRTGELDLLIIDSIAMMTPSREIVKSAEDGQRPDLALIINRAMRTIQASLNSLGMNHPNKPAILQVNQMREKIGVMYGDPRTWPGGKGQNFAASILIVMRAGKKIDVKGNIGGKDDRKIGIELHFNVEKNKTAPAYKKGAFSLFTDDCAALGVVQGQINNFEQIVEYGNSIGLLGKGGSWFDLTQSFGIAFKNPNSNNGKFQGTQGVIDFLRADAAKAAIVKERILQEMNNASGVVAEATDDTEEEVAA